MYMKKLILFIAFFTSFSSFGQNINRLNDFINEWIGVPYKFGGHTKFGIDCSQFNKKLYGYVYGITLPDVCWKQWNFTKRIVKDSLQVGDLVFFNSSRSPSGWHCGCYIGDGNFVQSPGRGDRVKISSLNDPQYKRNYKGAGRVL